MGKIVISQNVTLDGVVEDPTGDEGGRPGGWFGQVEERDRAEWVEAELAEALAAEALLLGRRSDEWFASRWLSRTGVWADRLNALPKYVVSSTLDRARWSNATVIAGDAMGEIARLRAHLEGDIVVYGSTQLVHGLMAHDLVDELRLMVFPIVVGAGERLFAESTDVRPMRLVAARTVGDGLAQLVYQPVETGERGSGPLPAAGRRDHAGAV